MKNLSHKQRKFLNVKNKTYMLFPLLRIIFYEGKLLHFVKVMAINSGNSVVIKIY